MLSIGKQVLLESVQRLIGVIRTGKPEPGAGDSLPLVGIAFMLLTIGEKTAWPRATLAAHVLPWV